MRAVKVAKKTGDSETAAEHAAVSLDRAENDIAEEQIGEHLYEIAKLCAASGIDAEAALSAVVERRIAEVEATDKA